MSKKSEWILYKTKKVSFIVEVIRIQFYLINLLQIGIYKSPIPLILQFDAFYLAALYD